MGGSSKKPDDGNTNGAGSDFRTANFGAGTPSNTAILGPQLQAGFSGLDTSAILQNFAPMQNVPIISTPAQLRAYMESIGLESAFDKSKDKDKRGSSGDKPGYGGDEGSDRTRNNDW